MDRAISIRSRLQNSGCEFLTTITADYNEYAYTFCLSCKTDTDGNLNFSVIKPESVAGISGYLSASGGKLTFEEYALLFSTLSEGLLSPVSAPWVLLNGLKSGYISAVGEYNDGLKIEVDETYEENTLKIIVYTDKYDIPIAAEIFDQERRIIKLDVENFVYL